jgi:putative spermidine/putrescine transport system permease protein
MTMRILLRGFTCLTIAFLVLPVFVIVPLSFTSGTVLTLPTPGWSLRWYEDFVASDRWLLATGNSLIVGAATALVATTLGTMAAIGLFLGRFRMQGLLMAVLSAPLVVPAVITGVALYFAFARAGLNSTLAGLVLAHSLLALPFVVITVSAALAGFDRTLLRAAASLGAPVHVIFIDVLAPLIAPSIASGALFAFAISFDELIVALFIAGPEQYTLPRQMLAGLREFLSPTICAAAVVLTAVSLLLLSLTGLLRSRET